MPQTGATSNGVMNPGGNSTGFNIPFPAFGSNQVNIPGANPSNPYGGPGYVTVDPKILGDLTSAFGEGAGDSLFNFMASGAGYNPTIAQQLLDQFQPQIAKGSADIMSKFGAAGMGNSSSAGIAEGSFEAEMANGENTLLAQQYNQGMQNYMNILLGVSGVGGGGTNIGNNQGSLSGTLNSLAGDTSDIAGALSIAGIGGNTGTLATILTILGGI